MLEINKIHWGDSLLLLKQLPDNSVDSIVTDPPYCLSTSKRFGNSNWEKEGYKSEELKKGDSVFTRNIKGFMGKEWDNDVAFKIEIWKECFRVLKHGGHLLAFGGTRTYHRLVCAIEDSGFEIRDMISWIYGSGFPKSLNLGKQYDKMQGNKREVIGQDIQGKKSDGVISGHHGWAEREVDITKGNSFLEGWGTALKPACEPIVLARKPLSEKNIVSNVLKWGTGGINIDGCRIQHNENLKETKRKERQSETWKEGSGFKNEEVNLASANPQGRFPSNIILDEEAGEMLDEQSGISKSSDAIRKNNQTMQIYGKYNPCEGKGFSDKGGASRFFYCAKASKSERNIGCEEIEDKENPITNQSWRCKICNKFQLSGNGDICKCKNPEWIKPISKNNHPTVKPIKLIEYLVKLITPKHGIVLDIFGGSGTTAIACIKNGFRFILTEKEEEYVKIANARIKPFLEQDVLK